MKQRVFTSCLLVFCLFCSAPTFSQTISGKTLDLEGEAVAFANVLLLDAQTRSLYKGTVSDDQGFFQLEQIPAGQYKLLLSAIGFNDYEVDVFEIEQQDLRLGTLSLSEAAEILDAVTVTAQKPLYEQKIDRLVVNVSNSITAAGGTALEVLERSPGVIVDRQWNTLNLNGKSGVLIMINGKVSRMPADAIVQMLNGMRADNIEKIELIHTPPAQFEAEGNAGIIHLILKETTQEGFNGTVSLTGGYGGGSLYGASLNFNYRKNKFNLYGDYSYNHESPKQAFDLFRSFRFDEQLYRTDISMDRETQTINQQGRIGLDYDFSENTVVGFLVAASERDFTMEANGIVEKRLDGTLQTTIETPNTETNRWQHLLSNFNINHQLNARNTLTFNADYVHYFFTNPSHYTNRYLEPDGTFQQEIQQKVDKDTPMDIWAGSLDHRMVWSDKLTIESGVKLRWAQFENDIATYFLQGQDWQKHNDFSALYNMQEDVSAAYTSLSIQLSEQSSLKSGLRVEYTDANLGTLDEPDIVDRQYLNWFPSVFYTNNLSEQTQFQVAYSRRINRPNFTYLAPYFFFFGPNTILTGNSELQPSFTDKISLSYQFKSVQLAMYYSHEQEAIANWQASHDPITDLLYFIPENFDLNQVLSTTVSFPVRPADWLEFRSNLTFQWQRFTNEVDNTTFRNSAIGWNYNGSINLKLGQGYAAEVSGNYISPFVMGSLRFKSMGSLNIGFQKDLPRKLGTLKLNINDLLRSTNLRILQTEPTNDFRYEGNFGLAFIAFRLTYSRNFGNSKIKKARARSTSTEEERNRVQ